MEPKMGVRLPSPTLMKRVIIFDLYNTLYNPITGKLYRGSFPLLENISRFYQLLLITTYSPLRKRQVRNLKINPYFKNIIICKRKNLKVFRRLINKPKHFLIIGDRIEEEIAIGKKLKVETLLVNPKLENPITTIKKYLKEK